MKAPVDAAEAPIGTALMLVKPEAIAPAVSVPTVTISVPTSFDAATEPARSAFVTRPVAVKDVVTVRPTIVGLVSTTNFVPVPVWDAIEVVLPDEVMTPVRLAFVVTLPAVNPAAVPVRFVATPDTGVPSAGATSVLFESVSVPASVASVPLTTGSVRLTSAPWIRVVAWVPVVEKFPASAKVPVVFVSAVPTLLTTIAVLAVSAGILSKPAAIAAYSVRITADAPAEPVTGPPEALK